MAGKPDLPLVAFASPQAWEAWLAEQHAISAGVWLKIAKKGSGIATVDYAQALDVALCYGWIDGQKGAIDETYWRQRFTPRTSRSKWSKVNTGKVEELIAAGRMRPAGLREVERAKADGRWEAAYDGQRSAGVPEDLECALAENDAARAFWANLDATNRYAVLYRIQDAKRAETRARRIATFVAMLSEHKAPYPLL